MTYKYFAYGSNMLTERLRAANRCPSASALGVGSIRGFTLQFWKLGKDGSGKATIVRSERAAARVIGVVFEIDESERANLDSAEGNGYDVLDNVVVRLENGSEVLARTYIGTELDRTVRPYDWYRALVIAGAMQHDLPSNWIATLEATESLHDLDPRRRESALDTLTKAGYPKLLVALPV
jgi:hypothetical protein